MLHDLGWQTLDGRRKNQRLVLLYKIINGLASVETEDILTPADSRTRKNHSFKFKHLKHMFIIMEQRRAEARLGLFHRIVHKSVDIDAATLMTRSTRPTRKANEVQYTRHMTSKDCYKFSFIPRTIIQWNGIATTGDFNQYKSDLKSHDLTLSGPSYNY